MPISFIQAGIISGVSGGPNVLQNPTSLQFGPDGRLYVSEQNGSINAFTVSINNGQYIATDHEELLLPGGGGVVKSIQNHNDDGTKNNSVTNRQVTGILVTGTAEEPVLYISSSDPRIATNGEVNLDTNSGVLTRVTWDSTAEEWVAVDLIRGLPRSEENHSINGMVLSPDGTKLYLAVGGNTNNGAPSKFFSYTAEYALSGTVLEIDLNAVDALPTLTDPNGGQGGKARNYKYNLPTLDDPNIPNVTDGVGEDEFGMDEAGPWGGNDGLNMAILPADAPLRIYADGFRNNYDLAMTPDGKLFTVDNGSNSNLGGNPIPENGDEDGDGISGEATNAPNNGGTGAAEPLFLIQEGGYYGHPAPIRANQNQSWTVYNNNGNPDTSLSVHTVADISALVPDGLQIAEGFLIDPSKFAALEGLDPTVAADLAAINARLFQSGVRIPYGNSASPAIATVGSSTNGIVVYDSGGQAFNGVLDGKLFVTQFNDNVTLLNINAAGDALVPVLEEGPDGIFGTADDVVQSGGGDGILEIANNSLGVALSNPLDVTVGPNGTLWVAEIGGNEITVLAPSNIILPGNNDSDGDGILNIDDPFMRDPNNGTAVTISPGQTYLWDFDANADGNLPGPAGFGGGLTGVMINGSTDFEEFFQAESSIDGQVINLDNVKFTTAAGGGTTVIEKVSPGSATGSANSAEFQFHTGVLLGANVGTATIKWSIFNPAGEPEFGSPHQSIGAYIGTGDQSNYLKVAATQTSEGPAIQVLLENDDAIAASYVVPAANLFDLSGLPESGSKIYVELLIDVVNETATPVVSYDTIAGLVTIPGFTTINLAGSNVLTAIKGNHQVGGQTTGLAVGLFSTNNGQGSLAEERFQAIFDDIEITATEAAFPPDAVDDTKSTGVNTVLVIPVADLLANDTDPNPGDVLTVTQVANAVNGTVSLDDNGTPNNTSDDTVVFIPNPNFQGQASFDYTISDGSASASASVFVSVADAVVLYRVNAGGAEVAALANDPVQLPWAANLGTGAQSGNGFANNTGNLYTASIATTGKDASLPDYVPYQVFSSERYDVSSAPEMVWNFDVAAGGTYQVNLFFRNGYDGTNDPGERIFDVVIEGTEYFSDVDLSGTYGHQVAGMLSQTLTVQDTSLDIEFLHDVENPLINAIEIIQVSSSSNPTLPQVSISAPSPATVSESGDTGVTTLLFPVSFDTIPTSEVTVEYSVDINGVVTTGLTQNLGTAGANISVNVPNDDIDNGSEVITVTLTEIIVGSDVATLGTVNTAGATVTEDDLVDSFNGTAALGDDFSNDNANPNDVVLGLGSNTLVANQDPGDNDYITFEVQSGQQLIAANLLGYVGGTNATFLGIATGDSFPSENDLVNGIVPLQGGTVYDEATVGSDLLPLLTSTQVENDGTPTPGLATPLGAGLYTLWFGQNGEPASGSTLELVTEALLPPNAVDDAVSTRLNTVLNIPVADLLANDTDLNASDILTVTQVANAVNGTVSLNDSGTPDNPDDDIVIFTPAADFVGQASFDYTVSDGTATDTAAVAVTVADTSVPVVLYRVNAGGGLIAAIDGGPDWSADTATSNSIYLANPGSNNTNAFSAVEPGITVPSEVPGTIFDTERWDAAGGTEMLWSFGVTAGVDYEVRLFMGNGWSGTNDPGERIFDVEIEGVVPTNLSDPSDITDLNDIDLSADFGHQIGGMLTYQLTAGDDSLDIKFIHGVQNPLINGIEIIRLDGDVTPVLPKVSILNTEQTVSEGVSGGQVQISLATDITVPADEIVDIVFQIEPISATPGAGGDYEYVSSSATFGGGTYTDTVSIAGSSSDVTIPINILNDLEPEGSEAFKLTIVAVSANAQIDFNNSVATVTIADDDSNTALISLSAPTPSSVEETGDTGVTTLLFPVSFDTPPTTEVIVEYSVDINGVVTSGLTQALGTTGANISVDVPNDAIANGDETVTVTLTGIIMGSDVAALGTVTSAIATVSEDDIALGGAATLAINQNSNNVQISNFGNNSFQISNVGTKNITAVEIDVTNALYPDSVFDPFGLAGDTAAKFLTINTNGGTGVVSPNNNPNDPNNETYIGLGGTAGYEGIKLVFNPATNGGFNPGETLGFSVDMDPNSVAGTNKTQLDGGSAPKWDVGGVSGAELIGSMFTVTFEDGTTATGQLQGVGNQGGSKGIATQNSANLGVNLTVNGLSAGGVGTYSSGGPSVSISGPAGQTARIVLTKGFIQPVTPYAQFLADQLADLATQDFPANNAVEFQTVDIVLTGVVQDITNQFNFTDIVNTNYSFAGDDQLPLGFVASVIDPTNGNLPLGPVTSPIYLAFDSMQLPTLSLSAPSPSSVEETGDSGVTTLLFPVSFNTPPESDVTVEYSVDINGVVTSGLTQALGTTGANISVEVPNDDVANGDETVIVTLTNIAIGGDAVALGTNTTATATVIEDDIVEIPLPPEAVDDSVSTGVNEALSISVTNLLENDTDPNAGDVLRITSVTNAVNGTVELNDNGTPDDATDDVVLFTPATDFVGQASFDYVVTDGSETDTATVTVEVADEPDAVVLYRVNAGGPEVAAIDGGIAWTADTKSQNSDYLLNPGSNETDGGTVQISPGMDPVIAATTPGAIFQTERFDRSGGSSMQWGFAVPEAGFYEVRLFMGNFWKGTNDPGERVFDVAIEGTVPTNLNDVDLSAQFGHLMGGVITHQVEVTDGLLNIEFLHEVQNPLVNGIEILQV